MAFDFVDKFSQPYLHPDALLASIPDDRIGELRYFCPKRNELMIYDLLSTFDKGSTFWAFCRQTNSMHVIDVQHEDDENPSNGEIKLD